MDIKKISLIALNSKFIHSNLAVRYIKSYLKKNDIETNILEFSINDSFDNILKKIYLSNSNIICFSCYIWNREIVVKLGQSLKKIIPDSIIVLGGPEVSYDVESTMNKNPWIDYIIFGEGEKTFFELVHYLNCGYGEISDINGLAYNESGIIVINESRNPIIDLDEIPFPYEDLEALDNRIIYYETSRGCPFKCQYCLSSLEPGVRYFSLEKVYEDIDIFIDANVKQVKLVDRTFNCNKERCLKIMEYVLSKNGNTNFHFEISGKLIDSDFLDVVKNAPKGIFQFEIGIQSTNKNTLESITRNESFEDIKHKILKLIDIGNCHIHLDLIAGLPMEGISSFEKSFNDVYFLQPQMLQLGFLKLLRGSRLRLDAKNYGITYNSHPPYEVLSTKCMSYEDILALKIVEDLVETFYNSGRFNKSLSYLMKEHYTNPFQFYKELGVYYFNKNIFDKSVKISNHYELLFNFVSENIGISPLFNELLKFDYFQSIGSTMPSFIKRFDLSDIKNFVNHFLKNEENIENYMSELKAIDARQKLKHLRFEVFEFDVLGDLRQGSFIIFSLKNPYSNTEERLISFDLGTFLKLSH